MHLRRLTRTDRGEYVLRIPKLLNPVLKRMGLDIILDHVKGYIVISSAKKRLKALACRSFNKLRHPVKGKTT